MGVLLIVLYAVFFVAFVVWAYVFVLVWKDKQPIWKLWLVALAIFILGLAIKMQESLYV